jgi:hypothetical protein
MFMLAQSLYAQKSGLTYTLALKDWEGVELCDTFTVTVGTNNFATGTDNNYDCAGDTTWVDGITSLPIGKFDGPGPEPLPPYPKVPGEGIGPVSLADNAGVLLLGGATATIYFNFKTYTWTAYVESTGIGPESWTNNGTFSFVEATATTGGKVSLWTKPDVVVALPLLVVSGYPTGSYEILIWNSTHTEEYCDIFELTADGDIVGGLHNLTTVCGYPANVPTGGNYTFLPSGIEVVSTPNGPVGVTGGRGLLLTDNELYANFGDDVTVNWYFDFQSNTWAVYGTDGTTPLLLDNWGSFEVFEVNPLTGETAPRPTGGVPAFTPHK